MEQSKKIPFIFEKMLITSITCNKCCAKHKRIFNEEESIEILKILGLINNVEEYQNIYSCVKKTLKKKIEKLKDCKIKKKNMNKKLFIWRNEP